MVDAGFTFGEGSKALALNPPGQFAGSTTTASKIMTAATVTTSNENDDVLHIQHQCETAIIFI